MARIKRKISIEFDVEYEEIEWKGKSIPKTLYKYRDWENNYHRRIIENNTIWIDDSYGFNDLFDCDISIAYEELMKDEKTAEAFFRYLITNSKNYAGSNIEEEVHKKLNEGKYKNPEFIQIFTESVKKLSMQITGVFSATPINDNILMWSHYANSHKGFCIGFDSSKLFENLQGGGYLRYSSEYPIISPLDSREIQYTKMNFTKSIHWGYEVEYRLTTFRKTNFEVEIPKDTIVEVIFGSKMDKEHKANIKELVKKNNPQVKYFSCVPDSKNFKLNIIPED